MARVRGFDKRCPMAHNTSAQTVVETPGYLKMAEVLFTAEEREQIVRMVAADPGCGALIPASGGFRKLRVARAGMGKRGGARLIYIFRNERFPVFLIAVYAKSVKENLSGQERNQLAHRADEIFAHYGGREER